MPRLDGSGPIGQRAMTGRGLGFCNGVNAFKYGRGFRRGFCRGFRRGFCYDVTAAISNKEFLEKQKKIIENQLKAINEELENL
jgi:hypothetical protein